MAGMGIRVTPEQLQQVSARLDAGAAGIEGTLPSRLRHLTRAVSYRTRWRGRAHRAWTLPGPH